MDNLINISFIVLILSIPILYRYLRLGSNSIFYFKGVLSKDQNYKKAEFLRFIQVLIGFFFLLIHSFAFLGLENLILFLFLSTGVSFLFEITGIKPIKFPKSLKLSPEEMGMIDGVVDMSDFLEDDD